MRDTEPTDYREERVRRNRVREELTRESPMLRWIILALFVASIVGNFVLLAQWQGEKSARRLDAALRQLDR